tara:strand:+ start:7807 stop:8172 length:366 start_codon:yes stop_codon:yes gene_type:complete
MPRKKDTLLSYDEATGQTEVYHYDAIENRSIIETAQDIEPILIQNRADYNSFDENARWGNPLKPSQETFHHVGRIPNVILEQMPAEMRQGFMSGKGLQGKAWKKWLNDPHNKMFKTRPGRI